MKASACAAPHLHWPSPCQRVLAAAVHALVSESGCSQSALEQAIRVLEEKHQETEEYDLYDPYG